MSQDRCMNPGYLINGVMIQELAKIGYDSFKGLIVFIKQILKIGRINYQKYYVTNRPNVQSRENAQERGVPHFSS